MSRTYRLSAVLALLLLGPATVVSQEKKERSPDVIFVPTPQEVVDKMLELAKVTKDDIVYDLGCGDGRIVVTAAKKYGCKADRLRHRSAADQGIERERQEEQGREPGQDRAAGHLHAGPEQGQRDHALPAARA